MRENQVLAAVIGEDTVSHSNTLLLQISEVLDQAHITLKDIGLFAAASGPGSFTGLRIGLATVKGLAATLDRPCVGIPTLEAIARAGGASPLTVALLPAGRGELFAQKFMVASEGRVSALDEPAHINPSEVLRKYGKEPNVRWCGEGAQAHRNEIQIWAAQNGFDFNDLALEDRKSQTGWILSPPEFQLAEHVGALAQLRMQENEIDDANSLTALYVRPSDAELKHVNDPISS